MRVNDILLELDCWHETIQINNEMIQVCKPMINSSSVNPIQARYEREIEFARFYIQALEKELKKERGKNAEGEGNGV